MARPTFNIVQMMMGFLIVLLILLLVLIGMAIQKWMALGAFPESEITPIALVISSTGILYLQYLRLKNQQKNTER